MKLGAKYILPRLALLITTVIWGSAFFVMKNTLDDVPPSYLLASRFLGAAIILSLVFFKKLKLINRDYLIKGGIMGALMFFGYYTQTLGLELTTPGKNAFLTAVYCVIVPFLGWAVTRDKPDKFNIIAALLCISGIGLVSLTENLTIGLGDLLTLVCGFFYAAHILAVAKYSQEKDIFLLTIVQFFSTGIMALIVALFTEQMPRAIPANTVISLVYLCVMSTTVALLLQNVGQKYTPPSSAAIILSLESVFGVIFSVIFYHEEISLRLLAGFILIFISVLISETKLDFLKKNKSMSPQDALSARN